MANSLVPYIQVGFDFEALCVHGRFDLGRCEDEHTAFSAAVSYDSVAVFNEAPLVVEAYLHSLLDNLTYRDQILCDRGNVQYVLEVGLLAVVAKWNVPDMLYWMRRIIACFDLSGSLECVQFSEPLLMRRHVVGCTRVNEPYIA